MLVEVALSHNVVALRELLLHKVLFQGLQLLESNAFLVAHMRHETHDEVDFC